jgi:hypothetical protein
VSAFADPLRPLAYLLQYSTEGEIPDQLALTAMSAIGHHPDEIAALLSDWLACSVLAHLCSALMQSMTGCTGGLW